MSLELPNLDDRTYNDLVAEALSLIPTYAPEWTNYNPSDPGITLIELFAYLTEMLIYRLNQVTDANKEAFLKLINGSDWKRSQQKTLNEEIRDAVLALRSSERAVTCEDFESLALAADNRVARARCIPRCNLLRDAETSKAGHISIIIVPRQAMNPPDLEQLDLEQLDLEQLINNVYKDLEPRRLLTTQLHVVAPQYLPVTIKATVVRLPDAEEEAIQKAVRDAVQKFLAPLLDGHPETGWPFGRNVFISEIYELLDKLPGVDYITSVTLSTEIAGRLIKNQQEDAIGIELKPYELVEAQITLADVTVLTVETEEV